jgi:hypothetical protein
MIGLERVKGMFKREKRAMQVYRYDNDDIDE